MIEDAINAVKALTTAAEDMGVSGEHLRTTAMIPVIAGMKDHALAKKLLEQTEKQVLMGSVPGSTDLAALEGYVYSLRSSVYSVENVPPMIISKLRSYEKTLQNRLSISVQEIMTQCRADLEKDDWLEVSSTEIADKIIQSSLS